MTCTHAENYEKYIAHLFKLSCTHTLVEIYTTPAPFLHCWRLPNHSLLPALRGHYNPHIYLLRQFIFKNFCLWLII